MIRNTTVRAVAMAAALLAYNAIHTGSAGAQLSANASADVLASVAGIAPLTATKANDLNFGSVAAGASATPAAVGGGRFDITGESSFPVTVTYSLPSVLTITVGTATIPISFGIADGLLWAPFPTTFTSFDPNVPFGTSIDGTGNLTVGIIGTVSPPVATVTGSYMGILTMTVEY